MTAQSPEDDRVRCPRCGYDQRGVTATWKESCPIDGVCAECGLEFAWAHVFNSHLQPPRWCVEYARWWAVPWRLITTLAMSFLPWRFWRSLRMHHEPRWWRIGLYLILLLAMMHVVFCYEIGRVAFAGWRQYDAALTVTERTFANLSPQALKTLAARGHSPSNFVAAKRISAVHAVAHAIIVPWSTCPCGFTILQDGTTRPYPRHYDPQRILVSRFGGIDAWLLWNDRAVARTMIFPIWFALLVPATFVLLPVTRRVSRIRWAHLARIALYGMLWPALAAAWWVHRAPAHNGPNRWDEVALIAFVVLPVALTIWWGFAIARHLQMRRPWLTAISLAAIAYLLLMLCGYFWLIVHQRPDWMM